MKRSLSIAILLLFATPFVLGRQLSDAEQSSEAGESLLIDEAVRLTTEGVKSLHLDGDVQQAYRLFEEAVRLDSTYAPAKFAMAELLIENSPASAIELSRDAYLSDTTNHWYLNRYAQAVVSAGRLSEAQELYARLLELRPLDLNSYRMLAILYQRGGRVYDAIALLDTAEYRVGRNPYLVSLKQRFLLDTDQRERAISEAVTAIDESPFLPDNIVSLAELYRELGRDSLAAKRYDEALKLDSTRIETLVSLAEFYVSRGRERDYLLTLLQILKSDDMEVINKVGIVREVVSNIELYRRERVLINSLVSTLIYYHPKDVDVVEIQARHLVTLGLFEQAVLTLKSHLEDDPPQLRYYTSIIELERYLKRPDSVELYLRRAIKLFPAERDLHFEIAYLFSQRGAYDEAIERYMENLEGASDSLQSVIWGSIGDLRYRRLEQEISQDYTKTYSLKERARRMKSVYQAYDKALEALPNNIDIMNNYAYFLSENGGDLKRALAMAKEVFAVNNSNPIFIDTYAWILYKMGDIEEARVQMRRAVALDRSQNYEIALHYGVILYALGESTMAEFYWAKSRQWGASEHEIAEASKLAFANHPSTKKDKKE